jgi:hypothetical protein
MDLQDADALRHALTNAGEEGGATILKRNRRKARQDAWRAVARLEEITSPTTILQPTLVSADVESLPWEILE